MDKFKKTSIAGHILEQLLEQKFKYKGMSVNMFDLPSFRANYSKNTFSNELSRLKRENFIKKDGKLLRITKKGQEYIKRKQNSLSTFSFSSVKPATKNLIVMYDIPEDKKAEREWFRFHLKKFNYKMIQKSVWVGPSPLPKDFLDYLKEIKLKSCIKTFKLTKPYRSNSI